MTRIGRQTSRGGIRVYRTQGDRRRAAKLMKWNYAVGYKDTQGFGLSFGHAEWAVGRKYRKDV